PEKLRLAIVHGGHHASVVGDQVCTGGANARRSMPRRDEPGRDVRRVRVRRRSGYRPRRRAVPAFEPEPRAIDVDAALAGLTAEADRLSRALADTPSASL